eukprot:3684587-Pleurochrysis_carterae.AAC.1
MDACFVQKDVPASRVDVGVAEAMLRRLRMEDSVTVKRCFRSKPNEVFGAIFDAHSGSDVAEFAAAEYGSFLHAQLGDEPLNET